MGFGGCQGGLPPTLRSIDADIDDDSVAVTFALNGAPQVRTFREDRSIVVDVDREGGKPNIATLLQENPEPPKKAAPALAAVPAIAPPATIPANDAPAKELPPPAPSAAAPPPKEAGAGHPRAGREGRSAACAESGASKARR